MVIPSFLIAIWKLLAGILTSGPMLAVRDRIAAKLHSHLVLAVGCVAALLFGLVVLHMVRASGSNAVRAVVAQASTHASLDHLEQARRMHAAASTERARQSTTIGEQAARISALEEELRKVPPEVPRPECPAPAAFMPRAVVRELRR